MEVSHFATFVLGWPPGDILNVTELSPASGAPGSGVTIRGEGFSTTPSENIVTFAGFNNTAVQAAVTAARTTELSILVPEGAETGQVIVRVGKRTSEGVLFTMPAVIGPPSITMLEPLRIPADTSGVSVRVSGTGFQSDSIVTWDGSGVESNYVDPTLIVISPRRTQLTAGIHRIRITTPFANSEESNEVEFTVSYPSPSISSVSPTVAETGQGVQITIAGRDFVATSTVEIDDLELPSTFVNDTTLSIDISSAPRGFNLIKVRNPTPDSGPSNAALFTVSDPNQPPVVDAGPDQAIAVPSHTLNGFVSDDGQGSGPLSFAWSILNGPGVAIFQDPNALYTPVWFEMPGPYVLRLTASDGLLSSTDDVTIVVNCGSEISETVTLVADATDDVGVVGVQFQLDGLNFGPQLTVPPYSMPWNTRTVGNGCHTLTVAARDAAGNQGIASLVVNVQNP
jgi:hypothetical protein